ncbi:MAG: DUF5719 family protein [Actinomycetota bacterium]
MSESVTPNRRARREAAEREAAAHPEGTRTARRRAVSPEQLRPRGQTLVALVLVAILVVGAFLADNVIGTRAVGAGAAGTVPSGAWYCPHGGGEDWESTVFVSNPGEEPVQVRARRIGPDRSPGSTRVTVPAGGSVELAAAAPDRGSATVVEYFGGHVAAGWVARTGENDIGLTAEPCLPQAGPEWILGDGTTEDQEETWIVVMNPFPGDAVFTLTVLQEDDPPGGLSEWNDFVLKGGRSVAFRLNDFAEGDRVLGARIQASLGRIAASTLGVSKNRGVRSAVGWVGDPPDAAYLPGAGDDGTSFVTIVTPESRGTNFSASIFGPKGSQLVGGPGETSQRGDSAGRLQVDTPTPSTIWIRRGRDRPGFLATRRTLGTSQDLGATTGAAEAGPAWIVFPSVGESPQRPALVITNPGTGDAELTLTTMPAQGEPITKQITVRPGASVLAPEGLLADDPRAPVLVSAQSGGVVVATASYSQGREGVASYAVSAGAPIDPTWITEAG